MSDTDARRILDRHAIAYMIPNDITNTTKSVHIRYNSIYSSDPRKGWFAYQHLGGMNDCAVYADGTWDKYGEPFDTPEAALDAAAKSTYADRYDRWEEQDAIHLTSDQDSDTLTS